MWLYADPDQPDTVLDRRHCPMIAGDLAEAILEDNTPPEPVRRWLTGHGWHEQPGIGFICTEHPQAPALTDFAEQFGRQAAALATSPRPTR